MPTRIFSLGGSAIVPGKVDYSLLKKLKSLILGLSRREQVVIVCGGGRTAREYISALEKEGASEYERCSVGIECTRLNALLVALFLGQLANSHIPTTTGEFLKAMKKHRIVVTGGGLEDAHIGTTSDGTTAFLTALLHEKEFINLTNVSGLYDKDPRKFRNAKLVPRISYGDFWKLMGKVKEKPGQHFILDSYATKIITKNKIRVAILDGKEIKNISSYLDGRKFVGSVIG
ncbi:MAG TPA: UMP kinase [Nanoarchaeota archaeon]|nr:UMP kinase [Candidatus Pacearchaeota archaeon]HIH18182.1 UMP kinase [Nanoarchaeota archaeon]HIH34581.1 UMP kinase [Nanoarchaeota archaeon]HIH51845.1 UMP kinase [Nanoarchaeota archaeon]HIH66544.1 UMP kinase [Nanoarchaeota archaeon]